VTRKRSRPASKAYRPALSIALGGPQYIDVQRTVSLRTWELSLYCAGKKVSLILHDEGLIELEEMENDIGTPPTEEVP
jgi:hypothetical protein